MDLVKRFTHNSSGKDYVVGDLHGCYDELMFVLDKIKFNKETDRLFSVADLVDRGPKSKECADLIFEPWFHAVRGNHEQMMIDCLINDDMHTCAVWLSNGGMWYTGFDECLMKDLAKSFDELPYIIVIGEGENRINIVHAELLQITDEDIDNLTCFNEKNLNDMLWGRNLAMFSQHYLQPEQMKDYQKGLSLTICGHTPMRLATRICNQLFIDGGCVYHSIGANKTSHDNRLILYSVSDKMVLQYIPALGEILETPLDEVKRI